GWIRQSTWIQKPRRSRSADTSRPAPDRFSSIGHVHSRFRAAGLPGNTAPIDTRRILNRIIVPRVDRSRLEPGGQYRIRARSLRECTSRTPGGRATSDANFQASADTERLRVAAEILLRP